MHYGRGIALTQKRAITLDAAFAANPNRFKHVAPLPPVLPTAAWINPPKKELGGFATDLDELIVRPHVSRRGQARVDLDRE